MPEIELTVIDPTGLHARPAARFVQSASRFTSRIVVRHDGREANAKSLLSLLTLGLKPGSRIAITAEGADAEGALVALASELAPYVEAAAARQET
jgi:phosphotransferase system HPr (HPr) family protein